MDLNEDTYIMVAMKAYDQPNCVMSEFEEDLKRIKYIKRLIGKYKTSGELKERLILNHLIVLANVFGVNTSVRMLFYKLDRTDYPILKTFLLFLNYMPTIIHSIRGQDIHSGDITTDLVIGNTLRKL